MKVGLIDQNNPFLATLVACGYDKVPYLFKKVSGGWQFVKILDDGFTTVKQ